MRTKVSLLFGGLGGLLAAGVADAAPPQSFPAGFEAVDLGVQLADPVEIRIAESGVILLVEQRGRVRVHVGGELQAEPFLDLSDEVNQDHDRGLLGLALDPGFTADGGASSHVYLLYTVSPVPGEDLGFAEGQQYSFSRLTRYRAVSGALGITADPASRQVLLGHQNPDGSVPDAIASLHDSHSNGSLHFADDGSLFVATGDGAHYNFTDKGGADEPGFDDWIHPVTGLRGPTPAVEDSGAFRAQDLRSLAGKILRIDPASGAGLPSNPFYDGDPWSNASRVWALGLRNPYRSFLLPASGAPNALVIGDVGWNNREELNLCLGGENFGWPCFEGVGAAPSYPAFNPPNPAFPNCNTPLSGALTAPLVSWSHSNPAAYTPAGAFQEEDGTPIAAGFVGVCSTGGARYDGGGYPDLYDGRIFFSDYAVGWLHSAELDPGGSVGAIHPFAEGLGGIVALTSHPVTGDLYYANVWNGRVYQVRYVDPESVSAYGCGANPPGSLSLEAGSVHIGGSADFSVHNPLGTQSAGAGIVLGFALAPDPAFPCGTPLPGLSMFGPAQAGELLLGLAPGVLLTPLLGPPWSGAPTTVGAQVPYNLGLVGLAIHVQGAIVDPTLGGGGGVGLGLTEALRVVIGS
jgi:glucose/arabinose dehydrogenase